MDDLSEQLKTCKTGCKVGDRPVSHLMYDDNLVFLSPYSAGVLQSLRIYYSYGVRCEIKYNSNQGVIIILRVRYVYSSDRRVVMIL